MFKTNTFEDLTYKYAIQAVNVLSRLDLSRTLKIIRKG